jgi:hypothetical protein
MHLLSVQEEDQERDSGTLGPTADMHYMERQMNN